MPFLVTILELHLGVNFKPSSSIPVAGFPKGTKGMKSLKKLAGLVMLALAVLFVFSAVTGTASAQTDMTATLASLNVYWTGVETLGIGVLLFVLGRRLFRKV